VLCYSVTHCIVCAVGVTVPPVSAQPTLRLLHLYANEMNLYGDRGNVLALYRHCQWRGLTLALHQADRHHTAADLAAHHVYVWGGGQDAQQNAIGPDLHAHKAAPLREAHARGAVMLGICGGYQLLGHGYQPHEGPYVPGLGLLDVTTTAGPTRHIGNVQATVSPATATALGAVSTGEALTLVGFENHSGLTKLGPHAQPLAQLTLGSGNNGTDGAEGAYQGRVIGTYLHGPLLPKNPWLTDALLALAWAYATDEPVEHPDNPFRQPLPQVLPWLADAQQQALARGR
jgi:lipid II isoglutaminyl synthase (glutamine-hydrolysing)